MTTVKQFEEIALDYLEIDEDDLNYETFPEIMKECLYGRKILETKTGAITLVENFGGEGMGDRLTLVFKFSPSDGDDPEYFRYDGYWSSHDGAYWDETEGRKAEPKERLITEYKYI